MDAKWKYQKWDGGSNAWVWEPEESNDLTVAVYSTYGAYVVSLVNEPDDELQGWDCEWEVDGKLGWDCSSGNPQDLLDQVEEWVKKIIAKGGKQPKSMPDFRPIRHSMH